MTDDLRADYGNWQLTKALLKSANMAFAEAVGHSCPEAHLMGMAREVAWLQHEERRQYSALRRKLPWRRLTRITT